MNLHEPSSALSSPSNLIARRYRIGEQLGSGGMGAVHRAKDRLTGQEVALKQVLVGADQLDFNSRMSPTQSPRMALAHEFQTLSSLRHPNVISVLDYGFEGGQPYFTMSLLQNAHTLVEAARERSIEAKIGLMNQMLQALAYIHRRGILHRDLKPSNVLTVGDHVYVLDFGLAVDLKGKNTGEAVGTLAYIAPEVLMGRGATEAADLYSVGMMAYEILSGSHPYALDNVHELINSILSTPVDLGPLDTSDEIKVVLWRLLAKEPEKRFQTAEAVISALSGAINRPIPQETAAIRDSFLQAARFVGREAELGLLADHLKQIMKLPDDAISAGANHESPVQENQHKGSAWLIGGESGIGKSRLMNELRTRALVEGALVLTGQAVSNSALPYQLWRDVMRRLALHIGFEDADAAVLKTIVPDLPGLLGREIPDFPSNDPDMLQKRLSQVIEKVFQQVTAQQPVLLILEDLQWVGSELKVLAGLSQLVTDLPLMIVGNYRNDERPDLAAELPEMRLIPLSRLSDDEIAQLSASMLGNAGQKPQVISMLQKETEGNVFFLVEVVRVLAEESGRLSEIGQVTLPPTVFAGGITRIVQRRLSRVPDWARPVLDAAAVAGRGLDLALLGHIVATQTEFDLDQWLTECVNAAVLDFQESHWRFAHDKLREGLLSGLTDADKQRLHRQVAEAIESVYQARVNEYAGVLVAYWAAAGDEVKEGNYLAVAGKQAYDMNDFRPAKRHYERSLTLKVYERQENPRKGLADLQYGMGRACYGLSDYNEVRLWQEQALALYRELDDQFGIAESVAALGELDFRQGRFEQARIQVDESMAIYEALGKRQKVAYALMNRGVIASKLGNLIEARDICQQCHAIMLEVGEPLGIARALNNLGITYDMLDDIPRARQLYGESLAIRRELNDRPGIAYCLNNLGAVTEIEGDLPEAKRLCLESVYMLRQIGEKMSVATGLSMLAQIETKLKEYDTARSHLLESLNIRREIGDHGGICNALTMLGTAAAEAGDEGAAWVYFHEALQTTLEGQLSQQTISTIYAIADWFSKSDKTEEAVALFAFVRTWNFAKGAPTQRTDKALDDLRGQLKEDRFSAAESRGAVWSLEDVIADLLKRL